MSWTAQFDRVAGADATGYEDLHPDRATNCCPPREEWTEETCAQVEGAAAGARRMIESGAFGPKNGIYLVRLHGHVQLQGTARPCGGANIELLEE